MSVTLPSVECQLLARHRGEQLPELVQVAGRAKLFPVPCITEAHRSQSSNA